MARAALPVAPPRAAHSQAVRQAHPVRLHPVALRRAVLLVDKMVAVRPHTSTARATAAAARYRTWARNIAVTSAAGVPLVVPTHRAVAGPGRTPGS